MNASEFRQHIYQMLDRVLEAGIPLEIDRKGQKQQILSETPRRKLDHLKRRDCMRGDPEDLVHMDWSSEWRP